MEPLKKNLVVATILSAQTLDTTGELLQIKGCDISALRGGPINTEHVSPSDINKQDDDESSKINKDDFKGFNTIVGKVLDCKKIFSAEDCDNAYEQKAWDDLQVPLIFGYCELWDNVHDNATAAAAIARNHPDMLGFSVEGQILKRNNNILEETAVKAMALTMKPANKAARIQGIIHDDSSSGPNTFVKKAEKDDPNVLYKSALPGFAIVQETDFGLATALYKLRKAIDAGMPTASPGALTGGAALQKEHQDSDLAKLVRMVGKRPVALSGLKKFLPKANKEQLQKVYDHLKLLRLRKHEADATEAFAQLKK